MDSRGNFAGCAACRFAKLVYQNEFPKTYDDAKISELKEWVKSEGYVNPFPDPIPVEPTSVQPKQPDDNVECAICKNKKNVSSKTYICENCNHLLLEFLDNFTILKCSEDKKCLIYFEKKKLQSLSVCKN